MKHATRRSYVFILLVLLFRVSGLFAKPMLTLDEPKAEPQAGSYSLRVLDDGFARLHLRWANAKDVGQHVDLWLSQFKGADGQLATIGFDIGKQGAASLLPYLQNVDVSRDGTEILLAGSGLSSDVEYAGKLFTTVDKHETLSWNITLIRPGAMAPFRCPSGPQIVNADGTTAIDIQPVALSGEKTIGLRLSAFTSKEQAELGQIGFVADTSDRELRRDLPSYPLNGRNFMPPIRATGLTEGATYTGRIWFVMAGRDVMQCSLELQMPKLPRGELVSDSQSLTRLVTLPFIYIGGDSDPSLAVRLFEKNRTRRIDGITASLEGVTESPRGAFDLNRHISFSLNGTPVSEFTQLQAETAGDKSRSARRLQPGEQLNVNMQLHHLDAGKYAFALRFSGSNTTGVTPKVDVTINVKQHWAWAAIAVVIALILSYFISMGVVNWRERIRVRSRVHQLREEAIAFEGSARLERPRLADAHPPSLVFLRAVLDQTEDLMRHEWIFAPPASVYDHLARAERVVAILRRYSSLQEALGNASFPNDSPMDFYQEAIAEVMQRVGPQALDQQTADGILEDLGKIAAHLDDPMVWYGSKLKSKAKTLVDEASIVKNMLGELAVVEKLLQTLTELSELSAESAADRKFADAYWMVKLLYSRHTTEDISVLIRAYKDNKDNLEKVFNKADELAWKRLTDEVKAGHVTIEPVDNLESQESLHPMKFMLHFDNPVLAKSYLVCNVLVYKWGFRLTEKLTWARKLFRSSANVTQWPVLTNGARVTEYARRAGALEVVAQIRWWDGTQWQNQDVAKKIVTIDDNTELDLKNNLQKSEILLMGILTVVALTTGLSALYFAKPTFGSFADYVAILLWAVGIDQGKNLIQLLKANPSDPAKAASR